MKKPTQSLGRRSFLKKAAAGAAFAVPVIATMNKAQAQSLANNSAGWLVTAINGTLRALGSGTATPSAQTVPNHGNATITVTPGNGWYWIHYQADGGTVYTVPSGQQAGGTYTFSDVTQNHTLVVIFAEL